MGTVVLISVLITFLRQWKELVQNFSKLFSHPTQTVLLLLCATLLALQVWIFGWAPLNGESQALALGYFLMPLMMVLCGRLLYSETLTKLQYWAVALAALGVGAQIVLQGGLSWVSAVVMLCYPPYFILKRRLSIGALHSMFIEHACMLPLAVGVLVHQGGNPEFFMNYPTYAWLILCGLGVIGGGALLCFLAGSQRLPMSLFGMLSYIEPLLLFVVALLLPGGNFAPVDLATYLPIWAAVLCLLRQGWLGYQIQRPVVC